MASLILKQIERNTVTMSSSDTTTTVTLGTTLTSTAKTILLFSLKCNSTVSVNYQVLGKVLSTTQIQFERQTGVSVAVDIEYQVIEFTQGITVQHLVITQSSSTINTTITAVDLAKSFVIGTAKNTGTNLGGDDLIAYDLTTTTNLATKITTGTVNVITAAQVIQIDDAAVQKLTPASWTTGATLDVTVTTIDPTKTFWVYGYTDTSATPCNQWSYCSYVNSTTLRFTKSWTASYGSKDIVLYVVSLSSGVSVQNISTVIASGAATVSPSIISTVIARTALLINSTYQRFASSSDGAQDAGDGTFALSGLTASAFTATRAASPAYDATTNVQVLQFDTASTGSWFLLAEKNELNNTRNINGMR